MIPGLIENGNHFTVYTLQYRYPCSESRVAMKLRCRISSSLGETRIMTDCLGIPYSVVKHFHESLVFFRLCKDLTNHRWPSELNYNVVVTETVRISKINHLTFNPGQIRNPDNMFGVLPGYVNPLPKISVAISITVVNPYSLTFWRSFSSCISSV